MKISFFFKVVKYKELLMQVKLLKYCIIVFVLRYFKVNNIINCPTRFFSFNCFNFLCSLTTQYYDYRYYYDYFYYLLLLFKVYIKIIIILYIVYLIVRSYGQGHIIGNYALVKCLGKKFYFLKNWSIIISH